MMEYKTINEVTLPMLGFGTGAMGANYTIDQVRDAARIRAIRAAIEQGITHIDTAERYGGGRGEELIAEAIQGYDRSKLFITSKVLKENLKYDAVLSAAYRSIQRLQTPIDLYLIHHPNQEIPIEETMRAMNTLVDQSIIRHIGVSNFSARDMEEAQKYSEHKIVANEIEYSLLVRNKAPDCQNMESEIIPYCQAHAIFVIAYKPLARGQLARKGHPVIDRIAEKYGKTPAQVSLNWLMNQQNIVALTQAINPAHLQDSIGALGWKLDQIDMELLRREITEE